MEPTPCVQPVLPCCNPQCPPPIIPKQRPICPRNLPCPCPCVPVARGCCQYCELDPVTRRRPLIVSDSLFHKRPACRRAECFQRKNPGVRYTLTNYTQEVGIECYLPTIIYQIDTNEKDALETKTKYYKNFGLLFLIQNIFENRHTSVFGHLCNERRHRLCS